MARTEKKFGQVNQAASAVSTELVPTSANRRNTLINLTARGDAAVTIYTTTGSPAPTISAAISGINAGIAATTFTASSGHLAINPSKTRAIAIITTTSNAWNVTATSSNLVTGTTRTLTNGAGLTATIVTSGISRTLGGNNVHGPQLVFIDDQYALTFSGDTGSGGTGTGAHRYAMVSYDGTALTSILSNYTTPSGLADSTMQRYIAVGLQRPTTTTGVGYIGAMHAVAATITSAVELMGMYLYASAAESGRVYWSGTATTNKTAGKIAQYFAAGDYNQTYPVFAFSHTTDATDPWLNTTATGGSGTLATNLPAIPASASTAGFRLVANDGAFGDARKYLDGTVTYPAAPTGVTVPTASATISQVASIKFSPNGTYLAVQYNRTAASTSVATSAVVIYTRQANGTYSHTHSSGTAIGRAGTGNDSMCWSSDSSTIYVNADESVTLQAWNPFAGDSSINNANATTDVVAYTKYPNVPSYAAPTTGTSTLVSGDSTSLSVATRLTSQASYVVHFPVTGHPGIVLTSGNRVNLNTATSIHTLTTQLTIGTATTAPNYVNTVAQSIAVASGTVVQVSGVVLESGERIYIEPSANSVVDAVAYGVEIS